MSHACCTHRCRRSTSQDLLWGPQERGARLRARADAARALRHARVLRRFWHTSAGLVWQDAAVMALLAASAGGAVALWPAPRPPLEDAAAGAREE